MRLPNLSSMMAVGELRYIQAAYETPENRNPDNAVSVFLSRSQRLRCAIRGKLLLRRLRSDPFYYYVLARTRYYDDLFADAVKSNIRYVINIGCGSDTRAFRFRDLLQVNGTRILECDQAEAIGARKQVAKFSWPIDYVEYMPLDLNDGSWPDLEQWLKRAHDAQVLVMMEGVSPYVDHKSFEQFLEFLAWRLQPGSRIAYDYKIRGVADRLGVSVRTQMPFRLPASVSWVTDYHEQRGYEVRAVDSSTTLIARYLPDAQDSGHPIFEEDGLIRLAVPSSAVSIG